MLPFQSHELFRLVGTVRPAARALSTKNGIYSFSSLALTKTNNGEDGNNSVIYLSDNNSKEIIRKPRLKKLKLSKAYNKNKPSDIERSSPTCCETDRKEGKEREDPNNTECPINVTYPPGNVTLPLISNLEIFPPEDAPRDLWPVFRLMDENGSLRNENVGDNTRIAPDMSSTDKTTNCDEDSIIKSILAANQFNPSLTTELRKNSLLQSSLLLKKAHRQMIRLRQMDTILQNAQRQGRISFYMSCRGEEAIHLGAAAALTLNDTIFAQYREAGLLMWRGFTLDQFTNQCFSNDMDLGRGRQMPVHYGSRALNYHTISSPLGTQIIQAVGAAYNLKLHPPKPLPNNDEQYKEGDGTAVSVVFFGDGCTSASDFHAGCNFAATLDCPVVFICRNNGFAISTPIMEQFRGDGVVSHAPGYGIAGLRVDGNDIFAMNAAIREARSYALRHSKPVLVEAMTYRQSHHSTSDDSTRYRSASDVRDWASLYDPVKRLDRFMFKQEIMTEEDRSDIKDEERLAVLQAMEKAEKRKKPDLSMMFTDVYKELPCHLELQEAELLEHMEMFPEHYKD